MTSTTIPPTAAAPAKTEGRRAQNNMEELPMEYQIIKFQRRKLGRIIT
jgi:hypothetical protein